MKPTNMLRRIQAAVKLRVNPWLFDDYGSWVGDGEFRIAQAILCSGIQEQLSGNKRRLRAGLERAQQLITPLFENPQLRSKKTKWTNVGYCPCSPIGDYLWVHQAEFFLCVIDMPVTFVEGFQWWKNHGEPYRDSNPYRVTNASSDWDNGYLLGLAMHHNRNAVMSWLKAMESEDYK